jgi:hypothetical protein
LPCHGIVGGQPVEIELDGIPGEFRQPCIAAGLGGHHRPEGLLSIEQVDFRPVGSRGQLHLTSVLDGSVLGRLADAAAVDAVGWEGLLAVWGRYQEKALVLGEHGAVGIDDEVHVDVLNSGFAFSNHGYVFRVLTRK